MQWLHYDNIKFINISQRNIQEIACQKLSLHFCIQSVRFIEMGIHPFGLD